MEKCVKSPPSAGFSVHSRRIQQRCPAHNQEKELNAERQTLYSSSAQIDINSSELNVNSDIYPINSTEVDSNTAATRLIWLESSKPISAGFDPNTAEFDINSAESQLTLCVSLAEITKVPPGLTCYKQVTKVFSGGSFSDALRSSDQ